MIRDTGSDYKKAIVAVAIAGGVGATVAGAGLLAYRLWRRRTRSSRETKSDKLSEPVHTASASETGGLIEKPQDQPPSVVQPSRSHDQAAATSFQPPSIQKSATDVLSTSGTFEKVPSPAPESFEQISMSQMQESRTMHPALFNELSTTSQLPTSMSESTQPSAPTDTEHVPASSALSSSDTAAGEQSGRMHMKEKNDIVMVETNSSSSEDADIGGKQSAADSSAAASQASSTSPSLSHMSESPTAAEDTETVSPQSS